MLTTSCINQLNLALEREETTSTPPPVIQQQQQQQPVKQEPEQKQTIIQKKASVIPVSNRREKPTRDPFRYMYDVEIPYTMTAMELDMIKLTAQYCAINGTQFQHELSAVQSKSPQFDFLKQTHRHYPIFANFTLIYSRIDNPEQLTIEPISYASTQNNGNQNYIHKLRFMANYDNKSELLDLLYAKAEWETMQEEERRKQLAHEQTERAAISAIDWHDFVVVETIDFDDMEDEEEEESDHEEEYSDMAHMPQMPEFFKQPTVPIPTTVVPRIQEVEMDIEEDNDVDMDTGGDDDEIEVVSPFPNLIKPPPPLPTTVRHENEDIERRIRKGNFKRADRSEAPAFDSSKYFKDSNTGELIPIDQASNHIRIKTLDPRWKEQKQKEMEKFKTTNIAADTEITDHIFSMAKKLGVQERESTQQQQQQQQQQKPVWDGYSSSASFVQAQATLNPTIPQQTPQPNNRLPVFGPSIPNSNQPPPPPPPTIDPAHYHAMAAAYNSTFGSSVIPPPPSRATAIPPPPPSSSSSKNVGPRPTDIQEPNSKRIREQ
jgi:splicing factor 3A subunit 1